MVKRRFYAAIAQTAEERGLRANYYGKVINMDWIAIEGCRKRYKRSSVDGSTYVAVSAKATRRRK
jgi:hypothetical protein